MNNAPGPNPPPGWYRDPATDQRERYWDGASWTQVVRATATLADAAARPSEVARPRTVDPLASVSLAGWWRRFGSGLADSIIAWVLTIVLMELTAGGFMTRLWRRYLDSALALAECWQTQATGCTITDTGVIQDFSTLMLVAGGVTAAYCIVFLGTWGATLGQRLCGIKVIRAPLPPQLSANGANQDFQATNPGWLRAISKGLSWALFSTGGGIFMIAQLANTLLPLWHKRKQSLTDLFANTLVVRAVKGQDVER